MRVWVVDIATDGHHLVGHTKNYVQVWEVCSPTLLQGCTPLIPFMRWNNSDDSISLTLTTV